MSARAFDRLARLRNYVGRRAIEVLDKGVDGGTRNRVDLDPALLCVRQESPIRLCCLLAVGVSGR
jgi:hypothetical protein